MMRVEVLIIDELGFVPFDRVGGELLFNLITDRYERRGHGGLAGQLGQVRALNCERILEKTESLTNSSASDPLRTAAAGGVVVKPSAGVNAAVPAGS